MEAHHGDYTWVCGEREGLFHHLKIGNGGYGEVHQVTSLRCGANV